MKKIVTFVVIVAIAAVILLVGLSMKSSQVTTTVEPTPQLKLSPIPQTIFKSQAECEAKTGRQCQDVMCDFIPAGKTGEEACPPNGPYKGWVVNSSK